jgi:hypothetical protein
LNLSARSVALNNGVAIETSLKFTISCPSTASGRVLLCAKVAAEVRAEEGRRVSRVQLKFG